MPPSRSRPSSSASPKPDIGTFIDNGTLRLDTILGIGGYGTVFRAIDTRTAECFAVKCLSKSAARHRREIMLHRLASAHPYVVTVHRVVEERGWTFVVMDCADDADLFTQILQQCTYLGNNALIRHVFLQIIDAVEYCHSLGIYHRDLKPENILCFDNGVRIALTDFGLATTEKSSSEFRTGSVFHMSPECQNGETLDDSYCPRAHDVWSLAIILINLCTGRNPWKIANAETDSTFRAFISAPQTFLQSVLPISPAMNAILINMLNLDWTQRPHLRDVRKAIVKIDSFYIPDAVFLQSMARCPWELGVQSEEFATPQTEIKPPTIENEDALLGSVWSSESTELDMIQLGSAIINDDEPDSFEPPTLFAALSTSDISSYGSSSMILTPGRPLIDNVIPAFEWHASSKSESDAGDGWLNIHESTEEAIQPLDHSIENSIPSLDLDFVALSEPISSPSAPSSPISPVHTEFITTSSLFTHILPSNPISADSQDDAEPVALSTGTTPLASKTPLRRRLGWFSPGNIIPPSLVTTVA